MLMRLTCLTFTYLTFTCVKPKRNQNNSLLNNESCVSEWRVTYLYEGLDGPFPPWIQIHESNLNLKGI